MKNNNLHALLSPEEQVIVLSQRLEEKDKIISEKEKKIEALEERIRLLLLAQYSARSEKLKQDNEEKPDLFDEVSVPLLEEPELKSPTIAVKNPKHNRAGGGRRPLPQGLPRIRQEYELSEEERGCSCCGKVMECIGEESREQLEVIPALMVVVEHVRKKYACKVCQEGVKQARQPAQPIPKSLAGPGLLAHIIVSKFCDALPLYRQESILQRGGIDLNRSSLSQWVRRCAELLSPLVERMQETIKHYDVSFADETPVQVLKEPGRPAQTKSYMWVFAGGPPDQFGVIYHYYPGRQGQVATDFFEGYQGYLHADGYSGYNPICSQGTRRVGCWAHARRKFVNVVKGISKPKKRGLADEALARISQLYQIEKGAKADNLDPLITQARREQQAKPLLEAFKPWLEEHQAKTSANTLIGQAIRYTLNHWNNLTRYLEDGRLEIDNNRSERLIKPFVIGRKNWLFYDQVEGAKAGAILYSLIETCKHHQLDPYLWLRYALKSLPHLTGQEEITALLPYHCDPTLLQRELENHRHAVVSQMHKPAPSHKIT